MCLAQHPAVGSSLQADGIDMATRPAWLEIRTLLTYWSGVDFMNKDSHWSKMMKLYLLRNRFSLKSKRSAARSPHKMSHAFHIISVSSSCALRAPATLFFPERGAASCRAEASWARAERSWHGGAVTGGRVPGACLRVHAVLSFYLCLVNVTTSVCPSGRHLTGAALRLTSHRCSAALPPRLSREQPGCHRPFWRRCRFVLLPRSRCKNKHLLCVVFCLNDTAGARCAAGS